MTSLNLKKTIDDIWPLSKKKVLMRVDFNVPLKDGEITNDFRIRSTLPTIQRVTDHGGMVILMSHLGRPKGVDPALSLQPVATRLQELLGQAPESKASVLFAKDCLDADEQVAQLEPGQVLLLENVRFYSAEGSKKEEERMEMATKIASYGDYYVSDAFGTAHRNSATMTGIPQVLGHGAAGYLMAKEVSAFAKVLGSPPRPMVAIVGGAKVSDKILLLENMLTRIDKLIIGGAMAYTFLKAQGMSIGSSFHEEGEINELARRLLQKAAELRVEVSLPVDHPCHTKFEATDEPLVTEDANIPDGYMALDIGPKTIELYASIIQGCSTAIWNGPMGVFEIDTYAAGTFKVAEAMADATEKTGLLSIIGGGDSASAAELSGHDVRMSHVSTGGGASLELLEGKALPGLVVLDDKSS
mmetsp:Transcript_16472/g.25709  ORF Transcript_16472/g.25709 Transcript_16472/m.25709 type:complete len:414 (+) Transcript_16472:132-1373(+)